MKEGNEGCDCGTDPANRGRPAARDRTACSSATAPAARRPAPRSRTAGHDRERRRRRAPRAAATATSRRARTATTATSTTATAARRPASSRRGFTCSTTMQPDTAACKQPGNTGECLKLPVNYRDFKNESEPAATPTSSIRARRVANPISVSPACTGQTGAIAFTKRYCVPNSSGPAKKNDSTARCWDIAQAEPRTPTASRRSTRAQRGRQRTCATASSPTGATTRNGGHVPGYDACHERARSTALDLRRRRQRAPGVPGPGAGRHQRDHVRPVVGRQHVGERRAHRRQARRRIARAGAGTGATNQYRFSSAPHSRLGRLLPARSGRATASRSTRRWQPPGPGAAADEPAPWTEPLLCNLWPYWYSSTAFGAGNGCKGDQYLFPPSFGSADHRRPRGLVRDAQQRQVVSSDAQGWFHDSWFTTRRATCSPSTARSAAVLRRRRHVHLHQRRAGGRPRRRSPAPARQGPRRRRRERDDHGGRQHLPALHQPDRLRPTAPRSRRALRGRRSWSPATAAPTPSTGHEGDVQRDLHGRRQRPATAAPAPSPRRRLGLTAGKTLRDRRVPRRPPPDRVELPADAERVRDEAIELQARCGDGVATGAEECDCGDGTAAVAGDLRAARTNDTRPTAAARRSASTGPYCGDGMVQAPEECDLGTAMNTATYGSERLHARLQDPALLRRRHRRPARASSATSAPTTA